MGMKVKERKEKREEQEESGGRSGGAGGGGGWGGGEKGHEILEGGNASPLRNMSDNHKSNVH